MSRLHIYSADNPVEQIVVTEDRAVIAQTLRQIGVRFECWPTRPCNDDILAAYAPEIDKLVAQGGYRTVDVIRMTPDHPDRAALRKKFLSEHTHAEDEIRFFVEGAGLFTLHHNGRVFDILCTQGDLMSVPAGMKHWFDMGATPSFTAIRLFLTPDGWVASFTGDPIADRFPRYELS